MKPIVEKFRSGKAVGGAGNGMCGHCMEKFEFDERRRPAQEPNVKTARPKSVLNLNKTE
jgi:hypothetical protein